MEINTVEQQKNVELLFQTKSGGESFDILVGSRIVFRHTPSVTPPSFLTNLIKYFTDNQLHDMNNKHLSKSSRHIYSVADNIWQEELSSIL